jgi:hypothetical protein
MKLKKHPTQKQCYLTLDDRFKIVKTDENKWAWFELDGKGNYHRYDTKEYRTRSWCEMEIINANAQVETEEALWND